MDNIAINFRKVFSQNQLSDLHNEYDNLHVMNARMYIAKNDGDIEKQICENITFIKDYDKPNTTIIINPPGLSVISIVLMKWFINNITNANIDIIVMEEDLGEYNITGFIHNVLMRKVL